MALNENKSTLPKIDQLAKKWYLIDATDLILGRVAVEVATVLMGKNKPIYTPFFDTGDFIVVVNAEKIKLSGKKMQDKVYRHHTHWIGGLVERNIKTVLERTPEEVIHIAVRRMLPKTILAKKMIDKLKIYKGPNHPHKAQNPEPFPIALKKFVPS
ncbi:MAG: 50S ribosomal protein L13 [Planctomycetota bacterium]